MALFSDIKIYNSKWISAVQKNGDNNFKLFRNISYFLFNTLDIFCILKDKALI